MIRLYLIGVGILVTAIIANILAGKMGLKSWYDFLTSLNARHGFAGLRGLDLAWLFVVYPLTLGLGYRLGVFLFQKLNLIL